MTIYRTVLMESDMSLVFIQPKPQPQRLLTKVASKVINRRVVEVMPKPDMSTGRLIFRHLTRNDESQFIEAINHSRSLLRRWIPLNRERESDHRFFRRTMTRARVGDVQGSAWRRAAFINDGPDEGRFVGLFNLIKIQRGLEWTAEANWWVDDRLAGQGLATEAVQGLLDMGFSDHPMGLGLHCIRAMICTDNLASVRIAEKCGFTNTGIRDLLEINHALVAHHEFERFAA